MPTIRVKVLENELLGVKCEHQKNCQLLEWYELTIVRKEGWQERMGEGGLMLLGGGDREKGRGWGERVGKREVELFNVVEVS